MKRVLKVKQVVCVCMILQLLQTNKQLSAPQLQRAGVPSSMKTLYAILKTLVAHGLLQVTKLNHVNFYSLEATNVTKVPQNEHSL